MESNRRRFLAALAAGTTGALAGCGGDGSTPTETARSTPTGEMRPATATPNDEMAPGTPTDRPPSATAIDETATPAPYARRVAVGADGGYQFAPSSFKVPVGETVLWEWESNYHNVKPDTIPDDSDWSGTPGGDNDTFNRGHSYSYTFETVGEYSYHCYPHRESGMTASFSVTES